MWVFVVRLCGLGLGLSSAPNKAWLPFIPTRKRRKKKNSTSLCRCTLGCVEMFCGWFLLKETISNLFEPWLFYQMTRTQIAKTRWQRFVQPDYVDICVLTTENALWCVKLDYPCVNDKAERPLLELKARVVTFVVYNASFLSSIIANTSVREMWRVRMFVKEKYAVDLILLRSRTLIRHVYVPAQYFTLKD